jgi:hypothetical protein
VIREVEDNVAVIDHFPALELNGYSKRSGLLQGSGDFSTTVFYDGTLTAIPVTITEIGTTGEYKVEWTPPLSQLGYYSVQVLIDFNKDIWHGAYDVVDQRTNDLLQTTKLQADKIDLVPTLGPNQVTTGSLMDRMMNKDATKTYNQSTDSMQGQSDRIGGV